jgi:hypothetical protein
MRPSIEQNLPRVVGSMASTATSAALTGPDDSPAKQASVAVASAAVGTVVSDTAEQFRIAKTRAELEGVSVLKHNVFLANVANVLFKSDLLKDVIGWSRQRGVEEFVKDAPVFKAQMIKLADILKVQVSPINDEAAVVKQVYNVATSKESNASLGKRAVPEFPEIVEMFNNPASWGINGPLPIRAPGQPPIAIEYSDICLMVACVETFDEFIVKTRGKTVDQGILAERGRLASGVAALAQEDMGDQLAESEIEQIDQNLKAVVLSKLTDFKTKNLDKKVGASQKPVSEACDMAIAKAGAMMPADLRAFGNDFERSVPPGTQVAYEFFGGGGHHAVYIGSYAVIEVKNVTGAETGAVTGFVTISHFFDLLKRCRNGLTAMYKVEYTNPFPVDVVERRALWTIGRFPNYHIANENCENVASWITSNKYVSEMCDLRVKGSGKRKTYRKKRRSTRGLVRK